MKIFVLLLTLLLPPISPARERNTVPPACTEVPTGSICLSELRWTPYRAGFITTRDRISGVFENKTTVTIREANVRFSLFDKNDRVVQSTSVFLHLPLRPGESCPFRVTVEEPEYTGILRQTLYTKEAFVEMWDSTMAASSAEMQFPILFAQAYKLGIREYKRKHKLR